jgi:hypothetical protein
MEVEVLAYERIDCSPASGGYGGPVARSSATEGDCSRTLHKPLVGGGQFSDRSHGGMDPNLVIAALLHDAVEDQGVTSETIGNEFGQHVADIVMEVTDDKTLPKNERKRRQVENAGKKSHKAKLVKLADKTSNLRTIASSPVADWSVERRLEYVEWAKSVVAGLRGTSPWLERQFDEASERAVRSLSRRQRGSGNKQGSMFRYWR